MPVRLKLDESASQCFDAVMVEPVRRLFVRPSPDERAPYALPPGVPALQGDPEQLRRRLLLGLALVALVSGSAGFVFGRRRTDGG